MTIAAMNMFINTTFFVQPNEGENLAGQKKFIAAMKKIILY